MPNGLRNLFDGLGKPLAIERTSSPHAADATTLHGAEDRALPAGEAGEAGERILRVMGPDLFDTHVLPASGRIVLGRSSEADVCIAHVSVSRKHAVLHLGSSVQLEDLSSANGTTIASRTLAPGELGDLALGELAKVGAITLVVQRSRPAPDVVLDDDAMRELDRLVTRVAPSAIGILVTGETGVGKDVLATSIHRRSPRRDQPFVTINCAAFSESLLESELFGYERGAFTGATNAKPGLLESAEGGTVFLDEIGELPLALQPKLLRVIEDRQVRRLGSVKSHAIDVRFIAATNRDLEAAIARGAFRRDLYFRLNGVTFEIPPLRARTSEIAKLARAFVDSAAREAGRSPPALGREALALLESHHWPGNVRELRNVMERAVLLASEDTITPEHFPVAMTSAAGAGMTSDAGAPAIRPADLERMVRTALPEHHTGELREALREADKERVILALEQCAGNQSQAAKVLGVSRNTLLARIEAYGLPRPRKK